jgi:hypothetical protein
MGKRTIRKTSNLAAVQHQLGHRNVSYTLGVSANVSSFVAIVPTARRLHNERWLTISIASTRPSNWANSRVKTKGGQEGPP